MLYDVSDIANFFIWRANTDEEFGDNISNLKLQKLVYYAQGFSLAVYGGRLFTAPIKAWAHGPVVEVLYYKYRAYGAGAIPTLESFNPKKIDPETQELLEDVYGVYGQYSAWGLRNLTHQEPPWIDTPQDEEISIEKMREFFSTQVASGRQ